MEVVAFREPAGLSNVTKNSVIPTGAERSEAQWRDLFCCLDEKRRSLDYAALRAALLGMTEFLVTCDRPNP
jgi:hypothetical protein